MEKYTYLLIDFFTILFPFLFSFHPRIKFYQTWKVLWPVFFSTAALFIIWDIYFTSWKVWGFNQAYTCGYYISVLPIEEVLFFFCVPYACLFTYWVLTRVAQFKWPSYNRSHIWPMLFVVLLAVGLLNYNKWYTSVTFISLSSLLLLVHYYSKNTNLLRFFCIYLILLIPFFIVNGLLTGSFIGRVIVFYNDNENLGIRLLTIPLEDIFYGMLLILLNVLGLEYFLFKGKGLITSN